ncbi:MAG TPA: ribose 5-phosphate isomerase B [Prolixibacteraceae bacterium]|nr:ribose 5-phosphate isomerase B [Prolixibacteraceae bacterium]
MNKLVIALASDHAGFARKQAIIHYFEENGIAYHDFGCYTDESCDYPDFAHSIAKAISDGEFSIGITFCGSGQGISITANKHQKIRSAICWNPEIARLAREHNDANICAIPGRFVSDDEAIAIVEAYLNATFEGGRHQRRIEKIPVKE